MSGAVLAEDPKVLIGKKTEVKMSITDDGVMGGLSKGKISETDEGSYLFNGNLSLENNGGFSSLRTDGAEWNLVGWKGIEIEVKGDGRTYDLRLTTDERFRNSPVSFSAKFPTKKGEWTKVRVSFTDLKASWRGKSLDRKFDPAKIGGMGITMADGTQGDFRMEFLTLAAWK